LRLAGGVLFLVLLVAGAWWLSRRGVRSSGRAVTVLASRPLAQGASVHLVRVGGKDFLVGVSGGAISTLAQLGRVELEQKEEPAGGIAALLWGRAR